MVQKFDLSGLVDNVNSDQNYADTIHRMVTDLNQAVKGARARGLKVELDLNRPLSTTIEYDPDVLIFEAQVFRPIKPGNADARPTHPVRLNKSAKRRHT